MISQWLILLVGSKSISNTKFTFQIYDLFVQSLLRRDHYHVNDALEKLVGRRSTGRDLNHIRYSTTIVPAVGYHINGAVFRRVCAGGRCECDFYRRPKPKPGTLVVYTVGRHH